MKLHDTFLMKSATKDDPARVLAGKGAAPFDPIVASRFSASPSQDLFRLFLGEFGLSFHHRSFASRREGSAHSDEQNFCRLLVLKK